MRAPITVPYSDVAFTVTNNDALTGDKVLAVRATKCLPGLFGKLVAYTGASNASGMAGAIDYFMKVKQTQALPAALYSSINYHKAFNETLWRFSWFSKPNTDQVKQYQAEDSFYQIDLLNPMSDDFYFGHSDELANPLVPQTSTPSDEPITSQSIRENYADVCASVKILLTSDNDWQCESAANDELFTAMLMEALAQVNKWLRGYSKRGPAAANVTQASKNLKSAEGLTQLVSAIQLLSKEVAQTTQQGLDVDYPLNPADWSGRLRSESIYLKRQQRVLQLASIDTLNMSTIAKHFI